MRLDNRILHVARAIVPRRLVRGLRRLRWPYILPRTYRDRLWHYQHVAMGRHADDEESDLATLRLYAHVLDKGLHAEGWEAGHSVAVHEKASGLLAKYADSDSPTIAWAKEILEEFDRRQTADPRSHQPFGRDPAPPTLSPDEMLGQMRLRTSSRTYQQRCVEQETVERIVAASLEAPWSCSRQALRVYGSIKPETAEEILSCFKGFTRFGDFVPCSLVFCVDLRPYGLPRELFVPHLDVGLAAGHASLMASTLGLSVTYLSWGSRTVEMERKLRRLLDVPDYFEVVVGGACGYPEREAIRPVRKTVSSTLFLS
jgi:nitroreductase